MTDYVPENFDRERWQPDTVIPKGAKKALRIHQFAGEGLLLAQAITDVAEARKGTKGGYKGDQPTPLPVRAIHQADAAE